MKEKFKNLSPNTLSLLTGCFGILIGLLLLIWPRQLVNFAIVLVGIGLAVSGLVMIAQYFFGDMKRNLEGQKLAIGIVLLVGSVLVFSLTRPILSVLPMLIGIALLIAGICKLQAALDLMHMKYEHWYLSLVTCVISIILGIVLIINPFGAFITSVRIIGASMIFECVADMFTVKRVRTTKDTYYSHFTD